MERGDYHPHTIDWVRQGLEWRRATDFGTFMASCALRLWMLPRFDVVVAMTSPPLLSFLSSLVVPSRARNLVIWSMDLNPDEAIAAGWLREKSLTACLLSRMLSHSLKRAAVVVALDRFMKDRIEAKGIETEKIRVVPPWAHDDHVGFDSVGREEFRKLHGLSNKFVVMYSGNHSPCHPLDTLLEAADGSQIATKSPSALLVVESNSKECKHVSVIVACLTCIVFRISHLTSCQLRYPQPISMSWSWVIGMWASSILARSTTCSRWEPHFYTSGRLRVT